MFNATKNSLALSSVLTLAACGGGATIPMAQQSPLAKIGAAVLPTQTTPAAPAYTPKPGAGITVGDEACTAKMKDRSKGGKAWDTAVNTATNIDGACFAVTVGQLNPTTRLMLTSKPVATYYGAIAAPNCAGTNAATGVLKNIAGVVSADVKAEKAAHDAACTSDMSAINAALTKAATGWVADYQKAQKTAKTTPVGYDISGTTDLSTLLKGTTGTTTGATNGVTQRLPSVQPH